MEPAQIILIIVVVVLTTLLVVIGFHLLQIMTDFKKTLKKINKILSDTHEITHAVSKPIIGVSNIVNNLQSGAKIIDLVNELAHKVEDLAHKFKKEDSNPTLQLSSPTDITADGNKKPRFFHSSKP